MALYAKPKTKATLEGESQRQYNFERGLKSFSQIGQGIDPNTFTDDRPGSTRYRYNPVDWGIDVAGTDRTEPFAQCCRRHANLQGVRGRYGDQVYKDTSGGVVAYQCETCGWWRYGDLCGP